MLWIVCTVSFFVGSIVAVFLMSCLAIAQQADEQSDRTFAVLEENNAVQ
jgi:formate/nitrite transporter FocA (FNT family)